MSTNYPNKTIVVIIQARCGSSRLNSKVLMDLGGKSMLAQIIERCQTLVTSGDADRVVVATSTQEADVKCAEIAHACGVDFFRGSEEDVMERYMQTAQRFDADVVIRVTADCPLVDVEHAREMLAYFMKENAQHSKLEYVNNISNTGLVVNNTGVPLGLGVEIISFAAMQKADEMSVKEYQREPFMVIDEFPEKFRVGFFAAPKWLQGLDFRLTVDEQSDYELLAKLYQKFYPDPEKGMVDLKKIVEYLHAHPEVAAINKNVNQKTYYHVSEHFSASKIAFFCESSQDVGLGHVMRSITLANHFREKYAAEVLFYVSDFEPAKKRLSDAGFKHQSVSESFEQVELDDVDVLVVDVLNPGARPNSKKARLQIIVDDLHTLNKEDTTTDVVINSQIFADRMYYSQFVSITSLLGLPYLLLRDAFMKYIKPEAVEHKKQRENAKKILITFGGGDRLGSTFKVIEALKKIERSVEVVVVIGGAFPFMDKIRKVEKELPENFSVKYNISNMEDEMYAADIAFCTAGYTGYELISIGTPFFVIEQEDVQKHIVQKMVDEGVAITLGMDSQVSVDKITLECEELLNDYDQIKNMREKCYGLIDGNGTARVAKEIMSALSNVKGEVKNDSTQ